MLVNPAPDEEPHKHHQEPEPTVVAAIDLATRADVWAPLVFTLKFYLQRFLPGGDQLSDDSAADYVEDAVASIFPPKPTRGHEKKRKAGQAHGAAKPISVTPPLDRALGTYFTGELRRSVKHLEAELAAPPTESRRLALRAQIDAVEEALRSETLHRLCRRLCEILRSNWSKPTSEPIDHALPFAENLSVPRDDDGNSNGGSGVAGGELEKFSPDQPDELLQAQQLLATVIAYCDGDVFLQRMIEFKAMSSSGRNNRVVTVDDIASAADGPFACDLWASLTPSERRAKIYKSNEKLVNIMRQMKKEGEWPSR